MYRDRTQFLVWSGKKNIFNIIEVVDSDFKLLLAQRNGNSNIKYKKILKSQFVVDGLHRRELKDQGDAFSYFCFVMPGFLSFLKSRFF